MNAYLPLLLAQPPTKQPIVLTTTDRAKEYQARQVEIAMRPFKLAEARRTLRFNRAFWQVVMRVIKAILDVLASAVRKMIPALPKLVDSEWPAGVYTPIAARWIGKQI